MKCSTDTMKPRSNTKGELNDVFRIFRLILRLLSYFMFQFQVCKTEDGAMCEEELCYEYLLIDATIQANVLKQEENDPKNQDWV